MDIKNCTITDINEIQSLYLAARSLQIRKKMVIWPTFEDTFLATEIAQNRHWKIVVEDTIVCNWTITFEDKEIWGERDREDSIYIHRICTHPQRRGNRYIDTIITWAKQYALDLGKRFVRLDTLGNNTRLIDHYTAAGFTFLGMTVLTTTEHLPAHYRQERNCCLFELDVQK